MATRMEWYTEGYDASEQLSSTDIEVGQTFTIGTTGVSNSFNLDWLSLYLKKNGSPTGLYYQVFGTHADGSPDTTQTYGWENVSAVTIGTSPSWQKIQMDNGGKLNRNTKYFIRLKATGTANASNYISVCIDQTSPSYTGGSFWKSTDAGVSWTKTDTKDCLFEVSGGSYEGTLCTESEAANKAGNNASATSTTQMLVSEFVLQAEGVINAVTRFNWVDAYAALTDDVKHILNQTCSDLAAIYIITYDMSGYTDRVEAETMINVYRESVARGLSLLKNQEVKTFITGDT